MSVGEWSIVAASNTTLESVSVAEGWPPANVNNVIRGMAAAIRAESCVTSMSATTTMDVSTVTGDFIDVRGTTAITSLGTTAQGIKRTLRFNGALTFTHNGTSLILPGSANITTASGDIARVRSLGSGNWVCESYLRTTGAPVVAGTAGTGISISSGTTITIDVNKLSTVTATTADTIVVGDASASGAPGKVSLSAIFALLPLTESYTSPNQSISAGQSITLAHGLSAAPDLVQARIVCQSVDAGYSISDEVIMTLGQDTDFNAATNRAIAVVPDATNLTIRVATGSIIIGNKGTGAPATISSTAWRLIFRAWT
jgi:phosphohistidine swiveling domain-containing protein